MSLKYEPDPAAVPDPHLGTIFLSLRDAAARVPINFITTPGVHLTKACFSDGVYDDIPTQTCISDLIASQFRRLVLDLYWDNINRQFNLCPVELPPLAGNATNGYSVDMSALYSITAASASSSVSAPGEATQIPNPVENRGLEKRQSSASPSPTSTGTGTSAAPVPTSTGVAGTSLLELGPYKCSLDLNLGSILSLYDDYFEQTANTVSARLHYLTINLHAASPFTSPLDPAHTPMQGRLPQSDDLIGWQFRSRFPQALFTPKQLQDERAHLNRSWFHDDFGTSTDTSYFSTSEQGDNSITQNGWPGNEWILLTDNRRLLVSWGEVDPQMRGYNFPADLGHIFAAGYLQSDDSMSVEDNNPTSCFYRAEETTISHVNSSWAMVTINETNMDRISSIAQNLTLCGISPTLNFTLGAAAAQHNLDLYQRFIRSATFGWATGEPLNVSDPKADITGSDDEYRCALIDSTSGYQGQWRVDRCSKKRRAACRVAGQPYAWRVSTYDVPFDAAPEACPEHTTFDLPRTGLENTYLHQQILNDTRTGNHDADSIRSGVWINFNSLDQVDCWVTGGPNATCPYTGNEEGDHQRQVLIPTIAALIVLVLTVLTLLVKCNENRRNSRSRRRGDGGWEYEGVPS
ncbi:hypothetical protein A1O1_00263 [Capronia coronata CBS 617.96]|uniref:Maintenance of telomere capping protein 6 n=1 Tax=Capronia coronata CBS 617.96 TaxID=1182541 RepID=W9ZKV4_9EURO|nr:uncharacterized protein A1O1_00263 [Capronia coronata CBS 617.96]EXJ95144.1 hypothetical protein A1O1_00263 [Capronia coronata CBS 617.96]